MPTSVYSTSLLRWRHPCGSLLVLSQVASTSRLKCMQQHVVVGVVRERVLDARPLLHRRFGRGTRVHVRVARRVARALLEVVLRLQAKSTVRVSK